MSDRRLTVADLSPDQRLAHDSILDWMHSVQTPILTMGGFAGCLSGDTIVEYNRSNRTNCRQITMEDLFLKFNGYAGSGSGAAQRWSKEMSTYMHSLWPDGTVGRNKVLAVFKSGVKHVIRLDFSDKSYLVLTPDHPIAIPGGEFIAAGELTVGDDVLRRGSMRAHKTGGRRIDLRSQRIIVNTKYHPFGAYKAVVCNGDVYEYTRVSRARLVVEAAMNKVPYETFIACLKKDERASKEFKFLPKDVDVHHRDENTLNDKLSNLEVLSHAEHARTHSQEGNLALEYVREVQVTGVRKDVDQMTYDVQMASPANNFVANNIFVHNTGKSSLLGIIGANTELRPIAFVTYTGKASSVLRRKLNAAGIHTVSTTKKKDKEEDAHDGEVDTHEIADDGPPFCGTIHSLIYQPIEHEECKHCHHPRDNHDDGVCMACGNCPGYVAYATGEVRGWRIRDNLDRPYKLIVIDEASMTSDDMLEDIQKFQIPVLAVGDHGQLPPVNGLGSLMEFPDIRLEQIHRQAEGNPIIQLSRKIRETGRFDHRMHNGSSIVFDRIANVQKHIDARYIGASPERLFELGMVCGTNRRRVSLNLAVRKAIGRQGPPIIGEQVICLKNQRAKGIYNGMRGVVEEVISERIEGMPWAMSARVRFPEDGIVADVTMNKHQFNRERTFSSFNDMIENKIYVSDWDHAGGLFDWGMALTCHKSQGSSYKDLVVLTDWMGMDDNTKRRWAYTAVTRAEERVTILI